MSNPTGKGGFKEHPELSVRGLWDSRNSFRYWMQKFKTMSVKEFRDYENTHPEDDRTVAESLAWARVHEACSNAFDFDRVANRTEGMPSQTIDMTDKGQNRSMEVLNAILAEGFREYAAGRKGKNGDGDNRAEGSKGK